MTQVKPQSIMQTESIRIKEVSIRLMKPSIPEIDVCRIIDLARNWRPEFECDAALALYDGGIAQYTLCDDESHHKFYAAVILGKPSLRCRIYYGEEPEDLLDQKGNRFALVNYSSTAPEDAKFIEKLKEYLGRRGYRFSN